MPTALCGISRVRARRGPWAWHPDGHATRRFAGHAQRQQPAAAAATLLLRPGRERSVAHRAVARTRPVRRDARATPKPALLVPRANPAPRFPTTRPIPVDTIPIGATGSVQQILCGVRSRSRRVLSLLVALRIKSSSLCSTGRSQLEADHRGIFGRSCRWSSLRHCR